MSTNRMEYRESNLKHLITHLGKSELFFLPKKIDNLTEKELITIKNFDFVVLTKIEYEDLVKIQLDKD